MPILKKKVIDLFPEYDLKNMDPYKKEINIRHLLTMSSGLAWEDSIAQNEMMAQTNCAEFVMNKQVVEKPGTAFNYNTGGAQLLSVLLAKATGMNSSDFAKKYLFKPLNIVNFDWKPAPDRIAAGGNLLYMKAIDLFKFGQLFLDNGMWNGRQIIPRSWIVESTKNWIKPSWDRIDEKLGYGFLWWNVLKKNKPYYFYAAGYAGQAIRNSWYGSLDCREYKAEGIVR